MEINIFLTITLSSIAGGGITGFIFKRWIQNQLNKNLETHKGEVNKELETHKGEIKKESKKKPTPTLRFIKVM